MAYKMIIVDDERIIRQGLVNVVDWSSLGFEIVQQCVDGYDAIQYIDVNTIDVVLTDIKMTRVSGIELAKYIYEKKLQIEVVLISGYREFDLALEAMKYGVQNYILKPTDMDKPIEVFNNIRVKIDSERNNRKHKNLNEGEASETNAITSIIDKARLFVRENYNKVISLDDVAQHLYISSSYFSRIFKQRTGENFIDYMVKIKIERAIRLLGSSQYKVYEISDIIGNKSTRYFSKIFKIHTGYTPSEYRRKFFNK